MVFLLECNGIMDDELMMMMMIMIGDVILMPIYELFWNGVKCLYFFV